MAERVSAAEFVRRNDATRASGLRTFGRGPVDHVVVTLTDDSELRLSGEAYRTLPDGYPRWQPR